jgi:hypothetical protein
MPLRQRRQLSQLNSRDYSLYRAICRELEELQQVIHHKEIEYSDFQEVAVAMMDRRFLIEWLRELRLPAASAYSDCGLTEEVESQLLEDGS